MGSLWSASERVLNMLQTIKCLRPVYSKYLCSRNQTVLWGFLREGMQRMVCETIFRAGLEVLLNVKFRGNFHNPIVDHPMQRQRGNR